MYCDEIPVEDEELIRELMVYDVMCPISCPLIRMARSWSDSQELKFNGLPYSIQPSPLHWSRQREWPWIIQEAELNDTKRVLDIGGSWSVLKFSLATRCEEVVTLDIEPDHIQKGKITIDRLGFKNITQILGDVREMKFPDNTFDVVVNCSVMEHVEENRFEGIKECVRVLKPSGIFLLTMDVVKDVGKGFNLDANNAIEILQYFGFQRSKNQQKMMGLVSGVEVTVIMAKWIKP